MDSRNQSTNLAQPVEEAELKAHAVAPRISPEMIKAEIQFVAFSDGYDLLMDAAHSVTDGQGNPLRHRELNTAEIGGSLNAFTICMIVLKSGFTVIGQSSPVDPANFSSEIGQRLAYQDAFNKLWGPFGFALKQKLFQQQQD